jgi:hypothetical protein
MKVFNQFAFLPRMFRPAFHQPPVWTPSKPKTERDKGLGEKSVEFHVILLPVRPASNHRHGYRIVMVQPSGNVAKLHACRILAATVFLKLAGSAPMLI